MWHASVSIQRKGQALDLPDRAERYAIRALSGVGGETEWWLYNREAVHLPVGHLRVPVTAAEAVLIPPGLVTMDAGETGPQRPRSVS